MPEEQRNAIQRDKKAAYWAREIKTGRKTMPQVMRTINSLQDDEKIADMTNRLNKYLAMNTQARTPTAKYTRLWSKCGY
jgi:DNA-binding transcriptional regulator GbsR (MarR family)